MTVIKKYLRGASKLKKSLKTHGLLWTIEKSAEFLRLRLAARKAFVSSGMRQSLSPTMLQPRKYHFSPKLVDDIGVVPSVRPKNEDDYAFSIPFAAPISHKFDRVAVIAHLFYVEYAQEIRDHIENIPVIADLFISTDSGAKKTELESIFGSYTGGSVEIRVTPNKGRDIGPKIVGFADVYLRYECFLHIHSKRSPHGGDGLKDWRKYLLRHLLGSSAIVSSNLALLSHSSVGAVFAQHYFPIRGVLNWGYDFDFAKTLLARAGIKITKENFLEFPSGSMFWARSDAIAKITELNLSFDDFEEEAGKIDGTLAHAIERSYLFFVEAAGYKWAKVSLPNYYPLSETQLVVESEIDIIRGLNKVYNSVLSRPATIYSPLERSLPVCRRILVSPSDNLRPRLNLLIPTINPAQVFGGVATALKVFNALAASLGIDFDRRIIVTDAAIGKEALALYDDYSLSRMSSDFDHEERLLVDMDGRAFPLPLRRGDVFLASAWWNAAQAFELVENQSRYFSRKMPAIYLIQDFEANFSGWSTQWALAENTYRQAQNAIAIINSSELYDYMMERYDFSNAFLLPYVPNQAIIDALIPIKRKRQIIFYGRPSVVRNCFELILNGIVEWQSRNPVQSAQWDLVSVGEEYPVSYGSPLQNLSVLGKVDLSAYGRLLSESSIGISLMVSPHPSYPPLEMAQAGLVTITNRFENKDLSVYGDLIMNIEAFDAESLADAIEIAVIRVGKNTQCRANEVEPLRVPSSSGAVVDYDLISDIIRKSC